MATPDQAAISRSDGVKVKGALLPQPNMHMGLEHMRENTEGLLAQHTRSERPFLSPTKNAMPKKCLDWETLAQTSGAVKDEAGKGKG